VLHQYSDVLIIVMLIDISQEDYRILIYASGSACCGPSGISTWPCRSALLSSGGVATQAWLSFLAEATPTSGIPSTRALEAKVLAKTIESTTTLMVHLRELRPVDGAF